MLLSTTITNWKSFYKEAASRCSQPMSDLKESS